MGGKHDLIFERPLMNAAGFLGFAPQPGGRVDLARLGAFITNPISLGARTPAHGARFMSFPGGFLLHTGFPNPGLEAALRRYAPGWSRSSLPVLVHLLAKDPREITRMVRRLESVEGIVGVEIGLPSEADAEAVRQHAQAALGELPFIMRLPCDRALTLAEQAMANGAEAVSLGPARGALPGEAGKVLHGRLYGPALYPQALETVHALGKQDIPVIAAGGVYCRAEAEALIAAGAMAVQLDGALWAAGSDLLLD